MIADDSPEPQVREDVEGYFTLPFDTGISFGRNYILDKVETEYFMLIDDDTIFTKKTNLNWPLYILENYENIDLVAGAYSKSVLNLNQFRGTLFSDQKTLYRIQGLHSKIIDGFPIYDYTPNMFLARTEKIKPIKWDEELKICEHSEFFWRARKQINSTFIRYFYAKNLLSRPKIYKKFRVDRVEYFTQKACEKIGVQEIVTKKYNIFSERNKFLNEISLTPPS